jgi:hypothetical protein
MSPACGSGELIVYILPAPVAGPTDNCWLMASSTPVLSHLLYCTAPQALPFLFYCCC